MNKLKKIFGGDLRQFGMIFALASSCLLPDPDRRADARPDQPDQPLPAELLHPHPGHRHGDGHHRRATSTCRSARSRRSPASSWPSPCATGASRGGSAILLGLGVGALVGAWQGFWVAYVGMPAFIVTLAGMLIFRGANQYIGKSNTVPVPQDFQKIGAGYLPEVGPRHGLQQPHPAPRRCSSARRSSVGSPAQPPHPAQDRAPTSSRCLGPGHPSRPHLPVDPRRRAALRLGPARHVSFPISALILGVLVLIYGFISTRTIIGRHVYAVGGNRHAAALSGVQVQAGRLPRHDEHVGSSPPSPG